MSLHIAIVAWMSPVGKTFAEAAHIEPHDAP